MILLGTKVVELKNSCDLYVSCSKEIVEPRGLHGNLIELKATYSVHDAFMRVSIDCKIDLPVPYREIMSRIFRRTAGLIGTFSPFTLKRK